MIIRAGEYDYLNARIRGMSRHLLNRDVMDQLLQADDVQPVIDVLMDSVYETELSMALEKEQGIAAAEEALRRNLHATLTKILRIAPPGPRRLLEIQLNRWDLVNILSLIRGKRSGYTSREILRGMIPAGQFHSVQLQNLAEEEDLPSIANALTTWGYEYASVLRRLLLDLGDSGDLSVVESMMFSQYYGWAFSRLNPRHPQERILMNFLSLQIDLQNVSVLLKQVDSRLRKLSTVKLDILPHGTLGRGVIRDLQDAQDMDDALSVLERTEFSPAVERGILSYGRSGRLGGFERFLEAVVIEQGARMFRADPLSVAIPLGFVWRKIAEYQNIRMIIRGKKYRFPPNSIREALVLV